MNMIGQLTDHFTLEELTESDIALRRGIENTPSQSVIDALKITAVGMEKIRSLLGQPIIVTSGYRSKELNDAIGGSKTSDHVLGYAVDFVCPQYGSPLTICRSITKSPIQYGQLIFEGKWVHISFNPTKRRQDLTAHFKNGTVTYSVGIP